jgi:UMF1 family MFS transporter
MYNSYLNDIAEPDRRDAVSSIGWAIGYVGGGLLLGLNLLLFTMRDNLGIPTGMAIRIILCSAGAWWAIFSLIPLLTLKSRKPLIISKNVSFTAPFKKLIETIKNSKKYPQSLLFLAAYLFYNDGIQSVIAISSVFAAKEIHLSMDILTIVILIVQFVAIIGALFFNFLSKKYGSRNSIMFSLVLWIAVVVYAFGFLHTQNEFIVLAMVIGLVLGGSQALSRSLFSLIIPKGMEAEYYSLYEVSERGTSWMGPILFGLSLQFTQSYRIAILSLIVFFVIGLILLSKFNLNKALFKINNDGVQ